MGRVRVGEGTVYVSTYVNPDPNGAIYSRMYNVLLRNLSHAALGSSPLDGECAAFTAAAGTGKPMRLYTLSDKLDEVERMLTACGYQVERMNPKPLLDMYDFETIKCKGEPFTSPDGKAVIIYYTVTSPTARKLEKNDLGLPDPMAQTFLDLEIEGEAELFVNAVSCGTARGNATFSDITIEGGFNHVFIIFRPEKAGSTLSMQWRNIMHEPEGSFRIG